MQKSDSLTFSFLGHSFKNRYNIHQLPVFWDRNLDSRAHKTSDLAGTLMSVICPSDCFCLFYQPILQLSSLTPLHQAISQLFLPGKQCCKPRRQAGVSYTDVLTSSSDGHRASPCPVCITLGTPNALTLGREPRLLLGSALGPGAIPRAGAGAVSRIPASSQGAV